MLGWPRRLICTLWLWWRGAQVKITQILMIEFANINNLIYVCSFTSLNRFLPQLVFSPLWCWVPVTQKSLPFSPSPSAGRESAVDALMTTFEYEHLISIALFHKCFIVVHALLCLHYSGSNQLTCPFLFILGHGERGQCVQKWTTRTTSRTPAPDQSDLTPVCVLGRLSGDWKSRWRRGRTPRVSQRKDVLAHCQVDSHNSLDTVCLHL